MEIKINKMNKLEEGGRLKAFFDVVFDDVLLVKGYRLIEGRTGLFVSPPQEQGKDRRWYEVVKCLSPDLAEEINKKAIEEYEKQTNGGSDVE